MRTAGLRSDSEVAKTVLSGKKSPLGGRVSYVYEHRVSHPAETIKITKKSGSIAKVMLPLLERLSELCVRFS